jgi:hypothetical protein
MLAFGDQILRSVHSLTLPILVRWPDEELGAGGLIVREVAHPELASIAKGVVVVHIVCG